MTITDKVLADLQDLGADSHDVAVKLQQLGICGKRNITRGCPIYNYLKGKGHDINSVGYFIYTYNGEIPGSEGSCLLPAHVSTFIRLFDDGMFPNLILL
jgi:hypothetical protein